MSYATVDNVKSLFRNIQDTDDADAAVTTVEIQQFLDDAEIIINALVSQLYTLPTLLDNPLSFNLLGTIEKYLAADVVDDILNTYSKADDSPEWGKKGMGLLEKIVPKIDPKTCKRCTPSMKLPDTVYLGTLGQKSAIKIRAITGTTFKKGFDNW